MCFAILFRHAVRILRYKFILGCDLYFCLLLDAYLLGYIEISAKVHKRWDKMESQIFKNTKNNYTLN